VDCALQDDFYWTFPESNRINVLFIGINMDSIQIFLALITFLVLFSNVAISLYDLYRDESCYSKHLDFIIFRTMDQLICIL
jgi:hypothetical protein